MSMSWVKLDDGFPTHPKIVGLSDRAFRAYVGGICYCAQHLTDGLVPFTVAAKHGAKALQELTDAGLWEMDPTGYIVHDYLAYNPSKETVTASRAKTAERVKRWRNGVTNADTNAVSNDAPVPSRPLPLPQDQNTPAPSALVAEFEVFYAKFPRKKDRGHAQTAYRAARRKTSAEVILAGLEKALPEFATRSADKIPYPATWLRGEGWLDEPEQDSNSFEARLARGRKLLGVSDGS